MLEARDNLSRLGQISHREEGAVRDVGEVAEVDADRIGYALGRLSVIVFGLVSKVARL